MAKNKEQTQWNRIVMQPLLWRNDLESLLRMLSDEADRWCREESGSSESSGSNEVPDESYRAEVSVTIEDDNTVYDSLEEVARLGGRNPGVLIFRLFDRRMFRGITVTIRRDYASVYAWHASTGKVVHEATELVSRGSRLRAFWGILLPGLFGGAAAGFGLAAYFVQQTTGVWWHALPLWVVTAMLALSTPFSSRLIRTGPWLVIRDDERGFVYSNGEKIILIIIGGIVGQVIKLAFDWLGPVFAGHAP